MKIKLDDNVLVIAGKYRGKRGKVLRVNAKNNRVTVEKVNIRTKHIKKSQGQAGSRIQFEAPMDVSNVMVICPHCDKPTRAGIIRLKSGLPQRVCKKCKQSLDKTIERKHTKKK